MRLDIFSLTMKMFSLFWGKAALKLLNGLNNILRLRGRLPRVHCSLNNGIDQENYIAVIGSNGSRICVLSHVSLPSSNWIFSTEGLSIDCDDPGLIVRSANLDQRIARWAIQLLYIVGYHSLLFASELCCSGTESPILRSSCQKKMHKGSSPPCREVPGVAAISFSP